MWTPSRSPFSMSLCSIVTAEPAEFPLVSRKIFELGPPVVDCTG